MAAFIQTVSLALLLAIIFVGYTALFAYVCLKLKELMDLVLARRADTRIFRTVERARRDFS